MSINIATLTRHPERLGKDTLYELRSLLARYPYYQPARLLLLKNLYLLHDPTFDEELRRAAVYITERQRLFDLTEGPHYQLRDDQAAEHEAAKHEAAKHESSAQDASEGDRTAALIDSFLDQLPGEEGAGRSSARMKSRRCWNISGHFRSKVLPFWCVILPTGPKPHLCPASS